MRMQFGPFGEQALRREIARLMLKSHRSINDNKNHAQAIDLSKKALALLEQEREHEGIGSNPDFFLDVGLAYNDIAYCCRKSGDTEGLKNMTEHLLGKYFDAHGGALPPVSDQTPGQVLAFMAIHDMHHDAIDKAAAKMEQCLSSGSYSRRALLLMFELRAKIYQMAVGSHPEQWEFEFERSLVELDFVRRKHTAEHDDNRPQLIPRSSYQTESYLSNRSRHPLFALLEGPPGERWSNAVERYERLTSIVPFELVPWLNGLKFMGKIHPDDISKMEEQHDCSVPSSLRSMYEERGPFRVHDPEAWNSFAMPHELFDEDGDSQGESNLLLFSPLIEAIDDMWGGRPEFEDTFDEDEIDFINSNYFYFGQIIYDEGRHEYFFFSRSGHFGSLLHEQEIWEDAEVLFVELLEEDFPKKSFDEVISAVVETMIDSTF